MEKSHKSYNARYMGFADVARTFVPNYQFRELVKPESSIIVGPRGCGKTTLLKMLHPRAYATTQLENNKVSYDEMNFWGVYIPADIQWTTLLKKVKEREKDSPLVNQVVDTLISVNVLSSICSCFKSLLELSINHLEASNRYCETLTISQIRTKEVGLAQDLITVWKIERDTTPTLYGIQQYWNTIISDLNNAIKNEKECNWILSRYSSFLEPSHAAFDAFYEHCRDIKYCALKGFRWALCFDELELAPEELRTTIYTLLRSTNHQEIIFKTTSSYLLTTPKMSETDAVEGHDYQDILNWVHDKKSEKMWESFCADLYSQIDEKKVIEAIKNYDLIRCLESSGEIIRQSDVNVDYKPGSSTYKLYVELAKIDESFKVFLTERGINPDDPFDEDEKKYYLLKKIKTAAICRYYCSKPRTITPFYFGKEILYDFSEGNPRLAINIMNRMISSFVELGNLDIKTQSSIFHELAKDKMMFYDHYPNAEVTISPSKTYSLGEILKKIGEYFHDNLYVAPFSDVSKNTFYLDQQLPSQIMDLVRTGIELGAIMKVDNTEVEYPVYKLAYILYPYFSLPKRLVATKPEKLSAILSSVINKDQLTIPFQQ